MAEGDVNWCHQHKTELYLCEDLHKIMTNVFGCSTVPVKEQFTVYGGYPHDFDQMARAVGPGWKKILRQLADELFFLGWSGDYQQIKEKFGTLRFYFTNDCPSKIQQDLAFHAVDHADVMSGQTCETCGKYGKLRGKGWYYTSCKEHAKEGDLEDWEKLDEGK